MLSFLRDVPDQSASILACGIERCILPGDEYATEVEREIARCLSESGAFISAQSDLHLTWLHQAIYPIKRLDGKKTDRVCVYRT